MHKIKGTSFYYTTDVHMCVDSILHVRYGQGEQRHYDWEVNDFKAASSAIPLCEHCRNIWHFHI